MNFAISPLSTYHAPHITHHSPFSTSHSPLFIHICGRPNPRVEPCTLSLCRQSLDERNLPRHIVLYNLHSSSPSILVPLIFNNYRQLLFTTMTKLQCKTIMTSQQVKTFLAGRHYRLVELQQQMTREPNSAYMYCKLIYFICA